MTVTNIAYPGPPTSGTARVLDTVVDSAGVTWTCTVAGTPGTYVSGDESTAIEAVVTTQAVSSGVAFTPNVADDTEVVVPVTTGGTLTWTQGPSTGAENAILTTLTVVAGTVITKRIPAGWKVVITLTTAVLGTVTVQTI